MIYSSKRLIRAWKTVEILIRILYNIQDIPVTEDITTINEYLIDVKGLSAFSLNQITKENIYCENHLKTNDNSIENANIKFEIKNGKIFHKISRRELLIFTILWKRKEEKMQNTDKSPISNSVASREQELAALCDMVSRQDIITVAKSIELDSVYFLRGLEEWEKEDDDE